MIVTKTPLRISFVGGGSDLPQYDCGMVVNTAIDKYIYVALHERCDDDIVIVYSRREHVSDINKIRHFLVRSICRQYDITKGIEIHTYADVLSSGSGVGSSAGVCVGLLHAIATYRNKLVNAEYLADEAYKIESERIACGKQDQYVAAYGGFNLFEFSFDSVKRYSVFGVEDSLTKFNDFCLLLRLPMAKRTSTILSKHVPDNAVAQNLADLCRPFVKALNDCDYKYAGKLVDKGWKLKCKITPASSEWIDHLIARVKKLGAYGVKVCGAGQSGHLLVIADKKLHKVIVEDTKLQAIPFKFAAKGSHVLMQEEVR